MAFYWYFSIQFGFVKQITVVGLNSYQNEGSKKWKDLGTCAEIFTKIFETIYIGTIWPPTVFEILILEH